MSNYKFSTHRPVIDNSISESYQDFEGMLSTAKKQAKIKLVKKLSVISALIVLSATLVYYSNNLMNVDQADITIEQVETELLPSKEIPDETTFTKDTTLLALKNDSTPKEPVQETIPMTESSVIKKEEPAKEEEKIVEDVFVQAEPKDGYDALYEYFDQHFTPLANYQLDSSINKIVVSFSIDSSGGVTNVRVEKTVHPSLDSIAIETVKNMPRWNPGTLNGSPIETNHKIPLYFQPSTK